MAMGIDETGNQDAVVLFGRFRGCYEGWRSGVQKGFNLPVVVDGDNPVLNGRRGDGVDPGGGVVGHIGKILAKVRFWSPRDPARERTHRTQREVAPLTKFSSWEERMPICQT